MRPRRPISEMTRAILRQGKSGGYRKRRACTSALGSARKGVRARGSGQLKQASGHPSVKSVSTHF